MTTKTFTVEGSGQFPLDMLRFDWCWPYMAADAAAIADHGLRRIKLVASSDRIHSPHLKRWESFGWKVVAEIVEAAPPEEPVVEPDPVLRFDFKNEAGNFRTDTWLRSNLREVVLTKHGVHPAPESDEALVRQWCHFQKYEFIAFRVVSSDKGHILSRALKRMGHQDFAAQVEKLESYLLPGHVCPPELVGDHYSREVWAQDTLYSLLRGETLPDVAEYIDLKEETPAPPGDPQHDFRS